MTANLAISAVKFVVGAMTGSTVMIAEGIHSLVDTGDSGLMLFGTWRSKRSADTSHPFGYGMELYFWSVVVAMVVFGGGGGLSIYKGVEALFHPQVIRILWPNYAVIVAAATFEGSSLIIGQREFALYRREKGLTGSTLAAIRASKNPAIFVTVLEDSAAIIGLAIAALGITLSHFLGVPAFDGVASILVGCVLVVEASLLGFECRGLITGEAARPSVIATVRNVFATHVALGEVDTLRTLQLGPDTILVVARLRLDPLLTVGALASGIAKLKDDLLRENPALKHLLLEL